MLTFKIFFYTVLKRLKLWLAQSERRLPIISEVFGVTDGKINLTKAWASDTEGKDASACYRVLYPEIFTIPVEPKCHTATLIPEPPQSRPAGHYNYWDIRSGFDSRQGFYRKPVEGFSEVFLLNFEDGYILGPSGAVLAPDRKLFVESIWTWDSWLKEDRSQMALYLPKPEKVNSACYVAASNYSTGYPHWIMEVLPRLYGLAAFPLDERPTLVFAGKLAQWQIDTLEALGFGDYQRIALDNRFLAVKSLYFPSYVGRPGTPHPSGCQWVRETIMKHLALPNNETVRKRLYITRRLTSRRHILNESELAPILTKYGFEIIEAETLSFAEQVKLFSQAEAVAAPHGAGLTNLLWVPSSCKVLEILDRDYVNDHYYNLSSILGLDYSYQLCSSVASDADAPLSPSVDNITVDPEKLELSLNALFVNSNLSK
jgi:capsular polysaccharide biosynthesis protein